MVIFFFWGWFAVFFVQMPSCCAAPHTSLSVLSEEGPSVGEQPASIEDPFEDLNRFFFDVNQFLDTVLLQPAAQAYEALLPPVVRQGIHHVIANLATPLVVLNAALEGEGAKAAQSSLRFFVNSTLGLGGLLDVAQGFDLPQQEADFGLTLRAWGVAPGPYLMLPIWGASSLRDFFGKLVDFSVDPFSLTVALTQGMPLIYLKTGVEWVDQRSYYADAVRELKESSLDLYASVRSLYVQKRGLLTKTESPL